MMNSLLIDSVSPFMFMPRETCNDTIELMDELKDFAAVECDSIGATLDMKGCMARQDHLLFLLLGFVQFLLQPARKKIK